MPRKFVLIDHSLIDTAGHHYHYAAFVLRSAGEAGYEPILATNRKFREIAAPWQVEPIYKYGFWFHTAEPRVYRWLRLVSRTIRRRGSSFAPSAKAHSRLQLMTKNILNKIRLQHFWKDTVRLFQRVTVSREDIVFIPTISPLEMQALLKVFVHDTDAHCASWHLLFRRPLSAESDLQPIERAFKKFATISNCQVRFYTDTEELAAQYNKLTGMPFEVLPIPHTGLALPVTTPTRSPLRIVYAGDARAEKGYHHLPHIVEALWKDYVETGLVSFILQSNYNLPEGEPEIVQARQLLRAYPQDKVSLLLNPLSKEEYVELLSNADIILLLYDAEQYSSRSSGIFVEALSQGIPVLVPSGTWMAKQLICPENVLRFGTAGLTFTGPCEIIKFLKNMIDNYVHYRQGAMEFADSWFGKHNAPRLISILQANSIRDPYRP